MYKLYFGGMQQPFVILIAANTFISLEPSNPDNTDYAQFKKAVAEGVELQDADGNVMSPEAAQAFVATLT
jgi:hypothetical protein